MIEVKNVIIIFLLCLQICSCHSQNRSINLVVIVNEKLEVGSLTNTRMKFIDQAGDIEIFPVTYYPGDLTLSESIIDRLNNENTKSFFLLMDHNEYCGQEDHIIHNYEIQLYPAWIEQPFMVLRFYNMNKKSNKERFDPLEGEDYTFEVDLASNSIMRVRKIPDRDDCN